MPFNDLFFLDIDYWYELLTFNSNNYIYFTQT